MNIIVYTAITANKDKKRDDVLVFSEYNKFNNPVLNAKIYKILSHKFVDADISIWIDGNIFLLVEPEIIVKEFLGDADICLFRHPERNSIFDEFPVVIERFKNSETKNDIEKQMAFYQKNNYNVSGLWECGFIIRRHNDKIKRFNDAWWAEICRFSERDQLSFPVVLSYFPEIKINSILGNIRNHKYFRYEPH